MNTSILHLKYSYHNTRSLLYYILCVSCLLLSITSCENDSYDDANHDSLRTTTTTTTSTTTTTYGTVIHDIFVDDYGENLTNSKLYYFKNEGGLLLEPISIDIGIEHYAYSISDYFSADALEVIVSYRESIAILNIDDNYNTEVIWEDNHNCGAFDILVEDLDNDGLSDLVFNNIAPGNTHIYYNTGDDLVKKQVIHTGEFSEDILCFDVNSDGIKDLIIATNSENGIVVLKGTPKKLFYMAYEIKTTYGTHTNIISSDMNNDGNIDIITSNLNNHDIEIYLSSGHDEFQMSGGATVDESGSHLAAGDFNNDNKIDIAAISFLDEKIHIAFGNGNGDINKRGTMDCDNLGSSIAVVDINNDNKDDIIATFKGYDAYSGKLYIYYGRGDGQFKNPSIYEVGKDPRHIEIYERWVKP